MRILQEPAPSEVEGMGNDAAAARALTAENIPTVNSAPLADFRRQFQSGVTAIPTTNAVAIPFILTTASHRGRLYDSYQRKASVISHHPRFSSARFSKLCWVVIAAVFSVAPVAAQKSVFVSFDAPDAEVTYPLSINQGGDITGYYTNSVGVFGFLRLASGKLTEFSAPVFVNTFPKSINRSGQITGYGSYLRGVGGFLRNRDGNFLAINVLGASNTSPSAINDNGEITGSYDEPIGVSHGFLRDAGGIYAVFDDPDAGTGLNQGTFPVTINANGEVAGHYIDSNNAYHGFIRDVSGKVTSFDVSVATVFMWPNAINSAGVVSGWFQDTNNLGHSFVRDTAGDITIFDGPGATLTVATGINDNGVIVGEWTSPSHRAGHGFMRDAVGNVTSFSAPFPKVSTIPYSINHGGRIIGIYALKSRPYHAFVATF